METSEVQMQDGRRKLGAKRASIILLKQSSNVKDSVNQFESAKKGSTIADTPTRFASGIQSLFNGGFFRAWCIDV